MNSTEIGHLDYHTLDDAWNSKKMQKIRYLIAAEKYQEAGCNLNCSYFHNQQVQRGSYNKFLRSIWEQPMIDNKNYRDNISLLLAEHQNRSSDIESFPVFFDIQNTEACNMNCIMCHQKHHIADMIPVEKWMKLFTHLDVAHTIRFQGGEVFLDNNFCAALSSLQLRMHAYQRILVITNGSLLTKEEINQLTDGCNPIHFIISLDATSPDIYKKIRRSSHFNKVMDNIYTLANKQSVTGIGDLVEWNFVVMKSNFFQIRDAIQKASEMAISIRFNPIIGDYPEENIFTIPEIVPSNAVEYLQDCLQFAENCGGMVNNLTQILFKLISAK